MVISAMNVSLSTARRVFKMRMEERPPIWKLAANTLNKQSAQPTRSGLPDLWLGEQLTNPYRKNVFSNEMFTQKTSDFASGTCECGNDTLRSLELGDFHDYLKTG
jgi:hypothetical protein